MDQKVERIKDEKFKQIRGSRCTVIEQVGPDWVVHQWSEDGVAPISVYSTPREAAARVLQLLRVGPVAPQSWPEIAQIGEGGGPPPLSS